MTLLPVILTIIGGLVGSGGIVFGALRYNRDEAGKVVTQQTNVLTDMRGLNDELVEALARLREERDDLRRQLAECTGESGGRRDMIDELKGKLKQRDAKIDRLEGRITALEAELAEAGG